MILELRLSTTSLKYQNFALKLAQFTLGRGIKMNGRTQENSLNLKKKKKKNLFGAQAAKRLFGLPRSWSLGQQTQQCLGIKQMK